jgi:hypothetical protein
LAHADQTYAGARKVRFIGRLHLIWVLIVLMAALVVFVMFVADVGGSAPAIPLPSHRSPVPTVN